MRRSVLGLLAGLWLAPAFGQTVINGVAGQSVFPPGAIKTTLTTTSGSATFNYSVAGFTTPPTIECTVENSSTTTAFVPQIASKSATQATINVLGSAAPTLSGNLLNILNITVGQPFGASTSTPAVVVDCIAAMPTQ